MTYYGRWTYKFEEGARQGARQACSIVHETGPAGYPFSVVQGNLGEKFDLVTPDKNMGRAAIEGWVTLDAAKKILKLAGQDFDALKKQAATRELQAGAARAQGVAGHRNTLRTIDSRNVVAKLEGSDSAHQGRARRLHRPLGSLRCRTRGQGGQHLQRRARQCLRRGVGAGDCPGVHEGAAGAEAVDPVPDGHRRGAGAAGSQVPTRSRRSTRWRRQSPTSTSTASTSGAGPAT